jgi:hypothetical protein
MIKPRFGPVIVHIGWFAGLPALVARELLAAGYRTKDQVRTAVLDGRLSPQQNLGLGPSGFVTLCEWVQAQPQSRQLSDDELAAKAMLTSAGAGGQPIRGADI